MKDQRQARRHLHHPAETAGSPLCPYEASRLEGDLLAQARLAGSLGSSFVAQVLTAASHQLWRAPRTTRLVALWPGDRAAAALAMRLNAALHALARRGSLPGLSALYQHQQGDFEQIIGEALAFGDGFILEWMERPTQTNEVGRAAAIWAALMVARQHTSLPFDLLELGSSSGLNLNLARYAYDLGATASGARHSALRIRPEWRGAQLAAAPVEIHGARGVDLYPLDPTDTATRERLMAYVWADDPARSLRLEQALDLAGQFPPQVDQGNAQAWLDQQLQAPPPASVCRVVFHSMVLQYLDAKDRHSVIARIAAAGAQATARQPFAWISFEWNEARSEVRLTLTCWPDGQTRQLAICHPYGAWIDWNG